MHSEATSACAWTEATANFPIATALGLLGGGGKSTEDPPELRCRRPCRSRLMQRVERGPSVVEFRMRSCLDQLWPRLVDIDPSVAELGPNLGEARRTRQIPNSAQVGPNSAKSAEVSPNLGDFGPNLAESAQSCPRSVKSGGHRYPSLAEVGQARPTSEHIWCQNPVNGRLWATSAPSWSKVAPIRPKVGRDRPALGKLGPNPSQNRPTPTELPEGSLTNATYPKVDYCCSPHVPRQPGEFRSCPTSARQLMESCSGRRASNQVWTMLADVGQHLSNIAQTGQKLADDGPTLVGLGHALPGVGPRRPNSSQHRSSGQC